MERTTKYVALSFDSRDSKLEYRIFNGLESAKQYNRDFLNSLSNTFRYVTMNSNHIRRIDDSVVSVAVFPTSFSYVVLVIDIDGNSIFPIIRNGYDINQKELAISDFERHLPFSDMDKLYDYVAIDFTKTQLFAMLDLSLA